MAGENVLEATLGSNMDDARSSQAEAMKNRFERLPDADKYLFVQGPVILSVNSSVCGLLANSFFRRLLNITEARVLSTLPMVVIPFASTLVTYEVFIKEPLMQGQLNCSTCALIRGGLTGVIFGCLHPALIALPLNASLASRYETTPMPSKENMLKYFKGISFSVLKKMRLPLLLQCAFGAYLASNHHGIYIKMLKMPALRKDPEELL